MADEKTPRELKLFFAGKPYGKPTEPLREAIAKAVGDLDGDADIARLEVEVEMAADDEPEAFAAKVAEAVKKKVPPKK